MDIQDLTVPEMMPSCRRRSVGRGRGRGRGRGTSLAFTLALTLAALALVASDPFAGPAGVAASPPVAGPGLPAARPPSVGDRERRGRRLEEVVVVVEDDHDRDHKGEEVDDHSGNDHSDHDHSDHDHSSATGSSESQHALLLRLRRRRLSRPAPRSQASLLRATRRSRGGRSSAPHSS